MAAAAAAMGDGDAIEKRSDSVYFTYGRFNPPTIGHRAMIDKMNEEAKGVDVYVFVTSTQYKTTDDMRKNPLGVRDKVQYLKMMYAGDDVRIINTDVTNTNQLVNLVSTLKGVGYTDIHLVVGSDRVETFTKMLREKHPDVKVESGGLRDMDSDTLNSSAMSATKMRKAAMNGNIPTLRAGINKSIAGDNFKELREKIVAGIEAVNAIKAAKNGAKGRSATRGTKRRANGSPPNLARP